MSRDSIRQNVGLIVRYYKAWSTGDPEAISSFFTPDFTGHAAGQDFDLAGLMAIRRQVSTSFPDQTLTTLDVVADAEKIAARWRSRATFECEFNGISPTHREVYWCGATIYRIRDGKIAEMWDFRDQLAIREQLQGAVERRS